MEQFAKSIEGMPDAVFAFLRTLPIEAALVVLALPVVALITLALTAFLRRQRDLTILEWIEPQAEPPRADAPRTVMRKPQPEPAADAPPVLKPAPRIPALRAPAAKAVASRAVAAEVVKPRPSEPPPAPPKAPKPVARAAPPLQPAPVAAAAPPASRGPQKQATLLILPFRTFEGGASQTVTAQSLSRQLQSVVEQLCPQMTVERGERKSSSAMAGVGPATQPRFELVTTLHELDDRLRIEAELNERDSGQQLFRFRYQGLLSEQEVILAELTSRILRSIGPFMKNAAQRDPFSALDRLRSLAAQPLDEA